MINPEFKLEWMEPPTANGEIYEKIMRELRARPGAWARVQTNRKSTAGANNWRKLGAEAKAVRTNPGTSPALYDIYVRTAPLPKSEPKRPSEATVKAVTNGTAVLQRPTPPAPSGEAERFAAQRAARGVPAGGIPVDYLKGNQH